MYSNQKLFCSGIMLLMLIMPVLAYDGTILKDYYFDINENEVVYLYPVSENISANISFEGNTYNMSVGAVAYSITLSSGVAGDIDFNITYLNNYTNASGSYLDVMRWREPIYINYSLYREFEDDTGSIIRESYGNDNFFLYAVPIDPYNPYSSDGVLTSTMNNLPSFGIDFSDLDFGDYNDNFVFTWDRLSASGVANMKFYEPDNYNLFLRNVKFVDGTINIGEFDKPEYDDSDLDYFLTKDTVNASGAFDVYFNEMEVRAFELYRNAIFYIAGFVLWIVGVVILLSIGIEFKYFASGAVGLLITIMGVISALL